MTEQLISFETAKLAKEKGFEGECEYWTCIGFKTLPENRDIIKRESGFKVSKIGNGQPHIALVPTQSLLQRWLREAHNRPIFIVPMYVTVSDTAGMRFSWFIADSTGEIECDETPLGYLTYEESLESALQKALELINP